MCGARPRRAQKDPGKPKPDPRRDLESHIESKSSLIGDLGIMPRLGRPVLEHGAGRVLQDKGSTDMEKIQQPVGAPGKFFRKIVGDDRVTQNGSRADRRHDGP